MDDYYALMGVEPDAGVDDIRSAYRDKKAELATVEGSGAQADRAKLNKAWNVLSDPYQRGRYDEARGVAVDNGELDLTDDDEAPVRANTSRSSRDATDKDRPRNRREPPKQTLELPKGMVLAARRNRLVAMGIDLLILLAMFLVVTQFAAPAFAKSQKPEVVHQVNAYNDQIDAQNKQLDAAKKEAKNDKASCTDANATAAKKQECALDAQVKALQKKRDNEIAKLSSIFLGAAALSFLAGFLYLVLPSMKGGQTLGKKLQKIRVVREDGEPIRAGDAIRRYGIIIIASFGLYLFLRELAPVLVLIGVTRWMSNGNQQGLHDRFAKTIVIDATTTT